jgi:hypothetical protein
MQKPYHKDTVYYILRGIYIVAAALAFRTDAEGAHESLRRITN